jgi:hexosaminidase
MKKNFFIPVLIAVFTTVILLSCKTEIPSDLAKENIIPKPVSVTSTGDYFTLKEKSDIYAEGGSEELKQIGQYLAGKLEPLTGFKAEVKSTSGEPWSGNIFLKLSDLDSIFGQEGMS